MLDSPIDFKEQMVEARRTQILMGAAQVFAEKGFHKATTKEIAKAAGISEGTIYNYFDNKRELLVAMVDLIGAQSLKDIVINNPPGDPHDLFETVIRNRFQLSFERGQMMAPLVAEIFSDVELREALYQQVIMPVVSHMEKYIQGRIESGEFRQIDPVIVTRAVMGALVLNFVLKLTGLDSRYDQLSVDFMVEQLTTLFVDGLLAIHD